ncbi:MAG: hypothetical protein MJ252_20645 [archaeon]|nr:hypothetical protein [archaeon]
MSILEKMGMCLKTKKKNDKNETRYQTEEKSPNIFELVENKLEKHMEGSTCVYRERYEIIEQMEDMNITKIQSKVIVYSESKQPECPKITKMENLVLNSLLSFKKLNENFKYEPINYSSTSQSEMNAFRQIEIRIHRKLHRKAKIVPKNCSICQKFITEANTTPNGMEINNFSTFNFKLKNEVKSLNYLPVKAILISMVNLMHEIIKEFIENFMERQDNFFSELYEQFSLMENIIPYIEKEYSSTLKEFKATFPISFTLTELFGEIFWDCTFRYSEIISLFIMNYKQNTLEFNKRIILQRILNNLLWGKPHKMLIAEALEILPLFGSSQNDLATIIYNDRQDEKVTQPNDPFTKTEEKNEETESKNIFIGNDKFNLHDTFVEFAKRMSFTEQNKEEDEKNAASYTNKSNTSNSNNMSSSSGNIKNSNGSNNINNSNINNTNSSNGNSKGIPNTVSNCNSNSSSKCSSNCSSNKSSITNNSSNQSQPTRINDQQSFDEFYNSTFNSKEDEESKNPSVNNTSSNSSVNNKKGKKGNNGNNKKKKKKKNKTNPNVYDPVVEEFKRDLAVDNVLYSYEVQKIIPCVSDEWRSNLQNSFDEDEE